MRKLIMLVLAIALIIPAGQAFAADSTKSVKVSFAPMHYVVDGVDYAPPGGLLGFINNDNNSTYVPLRFVGTILNKTVKWDAGNSKVTLGMPKSSNLKEISDYLSANKSQNPIISVDKSKIAPTSITISTREINYEFDGQEVKPDAETPGFIYKGSIYVPLRFVYESLGFDPKWDQDTYSITTVTPPYVTTKNSIARKIAACTGTVTTKGLILIPAVDKLTPEEIKASVQEVDVILADCKSELNVLLEEMSEQLTAAGLSTESVTQFRTEIEALEKQANGILDKYRTP